MVYETTTTQLENVQQSIVRIWGKDSGDAWRIVVCESGGSPNSVNHADSLITGYSSWGLWQLNRPFHPELLNFQVNTIEAKKLFDRRGWQPWTRCAQKLDLLK